MAKVTIKGVDYEIEPYSLYDLQQAAPFIDKLRDKIAAMPDDPAERLAVLRQMSFEEMLSMQSCYIGVLLPGLQQTDPTLTVEAVSKQVSFKEGQALSSVWLAVQREAGMIADVGESPAGSAPVMTAEAETQPTEISDLTPSNSPALSASSLQPAAAEIIPT